LPSARVEREVAIGLEQEPTGHRHTGGVERAEFLRLVEVPPLADRAAQQPQPIQRRGREEQRWPERKSQPERSMWPVAHDGDADVGRVLFDERPQPIKLEVAAVGIDCQVLDGRHQQFRTITRTFTGAEPSKWKSGH